MSNRAMQLPRLARLAVLACATAFLGLVPPASGAPAPECLIEGHDQNGAVSDNGTVCAVATAASPKFCTFNLQLCPNVGTGSAAALNQKAPTPARCDPGMLTV